MGIAGVLGVEHSVTTAIDLMTMMMMTMTTMYSYSKKTPAHWGQAYIYFSSQTTPLPQNGRRRGNAHTIVVPPTVGSNGFTDQFIILDLTPHARRPVGR